MERTNNYLIAREDAKKLFLQRDQEQLIRKWNLRSDEKWIFCTFLGREYRINRANADVWRMENGGHSDPDELEAGFEEVLTIFDLLTFSSFRPSPAGTFALTNSLKGKPKTIGVGTGELHSSFVTRINANPERFMKACESRGARKVSIGDIGYEFDVFEDLRIRLKFYFSDEEFPPQLSVMWDENALSYLRYETCFYCMGYLLSAVSDDC